jgi:nucleoside triphosphate pyrophosphatase
MPLWLAADPLLLASKSRARQSLLTAAQIPFQARAAEIDERAEQANSPLHEPGAIAALLARQKAVWVERRNPGRLVLGADQVLGLEGKCFAKPADRAAARAQLQGLRGRSHELHSAIAFVRNGAVLFEHVGVARLTMRAFSDDFLEHYLDAVGGAATESVGAYQIEGLGIQLFEGVEGEYSAILGLPLMAALDFLRRHGCLLP